MKYYHRTETIHSLYGADLTVDYGYNIENLPTNKPIWGFAYDINDDTENRRLSCLPVLGEISIRNGGYGSFYPYKKGTHTKKSPGKHILIQDTMPTHTKKRLRCIMSLCSRESII